MDVLTLVLVALAAARITRLVTTDSIADPVRDWLLDLPRSERAAEWWADLVSCPWCAGWWVAVAATLVLSFAPTGAVRWLALPWALSYAVGALATNLEG